MKRVGGDFMELSRVVFLLAILIQLGQNMVLIYNILEDK
jgi:hypothetical protein